MRENKIGNVDVGETFLKSYFQQPIYLNKNWETYVVTKASSPYFKNQQKVEMR